MDVPFCGPCIGHQVYFKVLNLFKNIYIIMYLIDKNPCLYTMGTTATASKVEHVTMMLFTNILELLDDMVHQMIELAATGLQYVNKVGEE